jgi:ABC-type lipoprotein release transport system permease subunit
MKLLLLSLKNALFKWWRSLTLSLFVFFVCLSMFLFSAFAAGLRHRIDNVIADGITGHVQVRSDKTQEGDMVVQQKTGWDDLVFIPPASEQAAERAVADGLRSAAITRLVRQSVFLRGPAKREETLLIGIEPERSRYRNAFLLAEGRYLDPARSDEFMLTREQAKTLKLSVGDRVKVTAKNRWGRNAEVFLILVGTGDFILLSTFSYKAAYARLDAVQALAALEPDMYTDLIVFLPDASRALEAARELAARLKAGGVQATITREDKLLIADLKSDALPGRDEYLKNTKLKISDALEMGEVFRLTGRIIFIFLNVLLVLLLVVTSFLIANLSYLTGLERYREIGTMRAIGFSRSAVAFVFMAEIFLVTAAACLAALASGLIVIALVGPAGLAAPSSEIAYLMGKNVVLEAEPLMSTLILVLSALFALAASFWPALRAASLDPARAIRSI